MIRLIKSLQRFVFQDSLHIIIIKKIITMLGHAFGKVIKIDYNTELATRGKFARIAVEVSLGSPLISQFLMDGRIQRVEYEALPTICFVCGKYGHTSSSCLDKLNLDKRGGRRII